MKIAFDIDGTLLDYENNPNEEVIKLLKWFKNQGHYIIVWSGGGFDYAKRIVEKLDLPVDEVTFKGNTVPDIAFDDQEVKLGEINIQIKTPL